jgi:hypothetical protein
MSATSSVQELFNNATNKVVVFGEAKTLLENQFPDPNDPGVSAEHITPAPHDP